MSSTAHEDQFTDAPEPVRQQYSTADILRRNVADLEIALRKQAERAEKAEAELAKLQEQEPIKYLYRVTDCFGHDVLRDDPKGATILETIPLFASPVPAPAVPEEWRKFVGFLAQQTTFPHPAVCICQACTWIKKARALLQSPAVNDSLTSQADCRTCANRGKVNGLSQESFCDSCIWQGMSWRKDHHAPAVPDANPVQWLADEGDMILVPRGLLGAACSSIDKQRPAPKVLEALRYYTMNAPQAPAVPEFCAVEAQLTLAETEMLNAKAWSAGTQAKRHIDFAMTAICCARALLQSAEVTK